MTRIYFIFLASLLLSGCAILKGTKSNTVSQNKIIKQEEKVQKINDDLLNNTEQKIKQTSTYAAGISYTLSLVPEPSIEVITASRLNDRIVSIVGAPDLKESERIKKTVDLLNSEIQVERQKGEKQLLDKDKEIFALQKANTELNEKHKEQVNKLIIEAKKVARTADENATTLDSMSGMFGLNAVFWGLKKFFISSLMWIIVFIIIFIVLRILSVTNPIAASIFSIFNVIASTLIASLKKLTPKAFDLCKMVHLEEKTKYKDTLIKIVNVIQSFKEKAEEQNKEYSLSQILVLLEKDMDQDEKDVVDELLVEEKWRKK